MVKGVGVWLAFKVTLFLVDKSRFRYSALNSWCPCLVSSQSILHLEDCLEYERPMLMSRQN